MTYYVYFIQAGAGGPIKIGIAWNVPQRLYSLQQAAYEELRRLGDLHCKDKKTALAMER